LKLTKSVNIAKTKMNNLLGINEKKIMIYFSFYRTFIHRPWE